MASRFVRRRGKKTHGQRTPRGSGGSNNHGIAATNVSPQDAEFIRQHQEGLSRTTRYAKWVYDPEEHEDLPGQSLATRSHDVIQRWAEERGARPATAPDTAHGERAGVLRLDFPDFGGQDLREISWDEWFRPFDERELVFVFQERKSDGSPSNFFRLDSPESEHA